MNISAIQNNSNQERRNLFIKLSNSFMSVPEVENPIEKANDVNLKTKMGIENIEEFTIFPKEVKDGRTIITA